MQETYCAMNYGTSSIPGEHPGGSPNLGTLSQLQSWVPTPDFQVVARPCVPTHNLHIRRAPRRKSDPGYLLRASISGGCPGESQALGTLSQPPDQGTYSQPTYLGNTHMVVRTWDLLTTSSPEEPSGGSHTLGTCSQPPYLGAYSQPPQQSNT